MNKLIDVIGEKLINIGTILYFMLFTTLILLAFSPFEKLNIFFTNITLVASSIYGVIIIYKVIIYRFNKKKPNSK